MPRAAAAIALLTTAVSVLHANAEVPSVVTDTAPVQSLVQQVMGDLGQPTLLTDRGADPHSYQLRPSQAGALQDAGLVVWIGPAMTPWLERVLPDPGSALALLQVPGTRLRDFSADGGGDGDTGTDPHAWLDPGNAAIWLDAIAARLGGLDPDNAATYAANAAAAGRALADLDAELAAQLRPARSVPLVFGHDAYGYFNDHYGLAQLGTVAAGDAAAPGAARLSALHGKLSAGVCLFPEALEDPRAITGLTDGTPVRVGRPLDPEGRTLTAGADLYGQLLAGLAQSIADCALPH